MDLHELGLLELKAAISSGRADAAEAVASSLDRIEKLRSSLNAIVETRPQAVDEARRAQGPLEGIPIAIKDMFVDGDRTPTVGSKIGGHWMSGTADVIQTLRRAGAVIVSYSNLHEWAVGTTSAITATGPIRNPWDTDRVAGGSSGGSAAALAAGLVPAAIGTDAGGSIRIPASCCGVVGLKPTWGAVPMGGWVEGHDDPIDHIGPMARSVADVRALFEVLVDGEVERVDPSELRLGIAREHFFEDLDPTLAQTVEDAVGHLDGIVADVREIEIDAVADGGHAIPLFLLPHTARLLREDLEKRASELQPETMNVVMLGAAMQKSDIEQGWAVREAVNTGWEKAFTEVDLVVTPTTPAPPPLISEQTYRLRGGVTNADLPNIALNGPMNLGGVPALSLPCGKMPNGLTANMTLTAAKGRDALVLSLGEALEAALGGEFANRIADL
jgi:aspartyl-tRNA(Asn)/glutamyl-tRNA(Gln) amidotransferase subunit A